MFKHRQNQYRHYWICSRKPNLDRRIYKCDDCEKYFNRKDVFNKRKEKSCQKMKFIKNRNYSCEVCEKNFNRKSNLKRHKLIHVPNVLHECNSCRRSFKRLDHYEKHHCMVEQQVSKLSDMSMAFLQVSVELA